MDDSGAYRKAGDLGGARHGDAYQVHVLMMMFERVVSDRMNRSYVDFRLATEMEAAGKFDDAVLKWKEGEEDSRNNWLFVQVKYKLVPVQLNEKHFFPDTDENKAKGEFSMFKYLISFWDILHRCEFDGSKQFVIFTNCDLAESIHDWFIDSESEIEPILKPAMGKERFLKMRANEDQYEQLLRWVNKDFLELVETMRSIFIDRKNEVSLDLVKLYRGALNHKILVVEEKEVKFAPRFIKRKKLEHGELAMRSMIFQDDATLEQLESYAISNDALMQILKSKSKSLNTLPPNITNQEVQEFFNTFILAIKQPNNDELKTVILKDLRSHQLSPIHANRSGDHFSLLTYSNLQSKVYSCLDSVAGRSLRREHLEAIFHTVQRTISSSRLTVQTDLFRGEMLNLRMEFEDPKLIFSEFLTAVISSTREGLMTCLKVFQILQCSNLPFQYFSLKDLRHHSILEELCSAVNEPRCSFKLLLLKDDYSNFEDASKILNALPTDGSIQLILVTDSQESAARFFCERQFNVLIEDEVTLGQLTSASQQKLERKTVLFQGIEIEINKLVTGTDFENIFKNESLEQLIQDKIISIGPDLPDIGVKYYIPRIVALSDSETSETPDTDATNTMEDDSCDKTSFSENQLLEGLLTIFGEQRVFVLSSTPGMGKTTLWKKLAQLAKSRFKTKWIFFLNLQDPSEKQSMFSTNRVSSGKISIAEYLADHFELPQLDRSLLESYVKKLDSVFLFIDGFDELPQQVMGPAIGLIRALQETVKIFVNTRTRTQLELKQALGVDVYCLNPLSKSEQTELFRNICHVVNGVHVDTEPLYEFIDRLMDKIHSKSMQVASKFVGGPLMVNMLAEIYKSDIKHFMKTNNRNVFQRIDVDALDIMELFEKFVYSSFLRQNTDKQNLFIDNSRTMRLLDRENYFYAGFVKLHIFLGLSSLVTDKKMSLVIRNKQELESFRKQISLLDSPIVSKVSKVPIFIHGSIAEFFAAKCLFKYLNRMSEDRMKQIFMSKDKRIARKTLYIGDVFDLYYQVLGNYPTVRKFFFLTARLHNVKLEKLATLMWCMRPYPLLWASEENYEALAKHLIEEDPAVVNSCSKYKETALHCAAAQGHVQLCTLLIDNKLDVNARNVHNQTALHKAAVNGCDDVVTLLMEKQADVSALDNRKQTPLFMAALAGHDSVVKLLTSKHSNINDLNNRKWSALHIAAIHNHAEVVEILLSKNAKTKLGRALKWQSFLQMLLSRGHRDMVTRLVMHEVKSLKRNADANQTLFWAIRNNIMEVVQVMHKAGVSISVTDDRSGQCTYQLALKQRSWKIAEYILGIQSRSERYEYALHEAATAGSVGCVSMLLEQKAEVNARDQDGNSPLDLALLKGHVMVVRMLLEKSAKIVEAMLFKVIRLNGISSLECVKELLRHGADILAVDKRTGQTLLHMAVLANNYGCTKLLLRKGATIHVQDKQGNTPLYYTRKYKCYLALRAIKEEISDFSTMGNFYGILSMDDELDEAVE
ncbi:uncharacterized protein LOC134225123 [Armigeres subalbatus]|uniref:uncharacterized protein LOC134225123 n=1 Tax=Armigeres subalbatus TaxID=124917 RepID=UPI002ED36205